MRQPIWNHSEEPISDRSAESPIFDDLSSHSIHVELSQAEILALYAPDQQEIILDRLHVLSALPQMVGDDFAMPVELNHPGKGWHWDFGVNKVRVDPNDLISKSSDYLRGVMLHEGAHRLLTRLQHVSSALWSEKGFGMLCNFIEDCRINNFVCDEYAAGRNQIEGLYQREKELEQIEQSEEERNIPKPNSVTAGFELLRLWYEERLGNPLVIDKKLPIEVQKFVADVIEDARAVWWSYPTREELKSDPNCARIYSDAAVDVISRRIWPKFRNLVERDLEDATLAQMLRSFGSGPGIDVPLTLASELSEADLQALIEAIVSGNLGLSDNGSTHGFGRVIVLDSLPPELKQKLENYLNSLSPEARAKFEQSANDLFSGLSTQLSDSMEGDAPETKPIGGNCGSGGASKDVEAGFFDQRPSYRTQAAEPTKKVKDELYKSIADHNLKQAFDDDWFMQEQASVAIGNGGPLYERTRREMASVMNQLEAELRQIFIDRLKRKWESGNRHGQKIDVPRRIREIANDVSPARSRIFMQRNDPDRVDYAISLTVDLSGSMHGPALMETFRGVVAMLEVLNRLGVKTEVLGFDGSTYIFKEFKEQLSKTSRARVGSMARAGGGGTNDALAVRIASERLSKQRATEKYLFVLTDGASGLGNYLERIIRQIREDGEIKLIGLGIGPGTAFVEHYYPNSYPNIDVTLLPRVITRLIHEVIADYAKFKR